jgi:hypothetical protein
MSIVDQITALAEESKTDSVPTESNKTERLTTCKTVHIIAVKVPTALRLLANAWDAFSKGEQVHQNLADVEKYTRAILGHIEVLREGDK